MGDYAGWNTEDELRYIDNIGLNNPMTIRQSIGSLLNGYRDGLLKRSRWGGIDRRQVLAYVAAKLKGVV